MSRTRFRLSVLMVAVCSLTLRWLVQPAALFGSTHDDELMVRLAASIRSGNWLGDYEVLGHLTLAKPPGYSMFLAWTYFLPWAPTVTVHLLILTGALITARELRALRVSRPAVLGFFVLAMFHPLWFGDQMSRIYRDGFLAGLVFISLGLALCVARQMREDRFFDDRRFRAFWVVASLALALGFCISWMMITKPDWFPTSSAVTLLLVGSAFSWRKRPIRVWISKATVIAVALLVGLFSMRIYVTSQNDAHYGVGQIDSFSTGSFPSALNAWASVKSPSPRKYVLVDKYQREMVYEVSPTAKKLEPFLELGWGSGWRGSSCASPMNICDESSAWFVWDLRDAVEKAGLGDDALEFERTLKEISSDIRSACSVGQLKCGARGLAPGVVALSQISAREVLDGYATMLTWLLEPDTGSGVRGGVVASPEQLKLWTSTVKGIPTNPTLPTYRPEASSLGNTVNLMESVYRSIWPLVALFSLLGLLQRSAEVGLTRVRRMILLIFGGGAIAFLGQLAILEASSGGYVTIGMRLYTLPVVPYFLILIGLGLSGFDSMFRNRTIQEMQPAGENSDRDRVTGPK